MCARQRERETEREKKERGCETVSEGEQDRETMCARQREEERVRWRRKERSTSLQPHMTSVCPWGEGAMAAMTSKRGKRPKHRCIVGETQELQTTEMLTWWEQDQEETNKCC